MHVLISSYSTIPGRGSEPGIGWAFVRAAAMKATKVTALVQANHVDEVQRALWREGHDNVEVVGLGVPRLFNRVRGSRGLGHLAYLGWQVKVANFARKAEVSVDLAHHVTYCSDWLPSGLWALRTIPVVWGPVGGYAQSPLKYRRFLGYAGWLQEMLREASTRALRFLVVAPVVRRTCTVIVAANHEVANYFGRHNCVVVEPPVALPNLERTVGNFQASGPSLVGPGRHKKAVFVGRLEAWKGVHLALRTLTWLPDEWCLEFIGEGRERARLIKRAARLGLLQRVRLHGQKTRVEVQRALAEADVLLFPSFHDAAGFVVAEAIQVGCAVVCLNVAGPPVLIAAGGGIAVEPGANLPARLASAVRAVNPPEPSNRWASSRLPERLEAWYKCALAADVRL